MRNNPYCLLRIREGLARRDVGDGLQQIGGLLLGDVGGYHLAIAFRHLEHAINAADEDIIVYCRSVMIIFLH